MKILIVDTINQIPSHYQYFQLSIRLTDLGHKVIHVTDNTKKSDEVWKVINWKKKSFFSDILFFGKILISTKGFDIVILSFGSVKFSFIFFFFAKKVFATIQSAFFPKSFSKKIFSSLKYLFIHNVVTLSRQMHSDIIKNFYFIRFQKVRILSNSISIDSFPLNRGIIELLPCK